MQPWWLSGLIHHVSNSNRDRELGPEFESRLRQFYKLVQRLQPGIVNENVSPNSEADDIPMCHHAFLSGIYL